jgi:hypothetical protein
MGTQDLVDVLKRELKGAGITYAELGARARPRRIEREADVSPRGDMPLARVDEICRVLGTDFGDLARAVADSQTLRHELTIEQEEAVVADRKVLLLANLRAEPVELRADRVDLSIHRGRSGAGTRAPGQAGLHRVEAHEPLPAARGADLPVAAARPGDALLPRRRRWRLLLGRFRRRGRDADGRPRLDRPRNGRARSSSACSAWAAISRASTRPSSACPRTRRSYTLVIAMRSWFFSAFRDLLRAQQEKSPPKRA